MLARKFVFLLASFLVVASVGAVRNAAHAHATGESYVFIDILEPGVAGRLELHERELRSALGISLPQGEAEVWRLLTAQRSRIVDYAREHFRIESGGAELRLEFGELALASIEIGRFAQLSFEAPWPQGLPSRISIRQTLFFEADRRHRGLLLVGHNARTGQDHGAEYTALIFGPDAPRQELDLTDIPGTLRLRQFLWQGTYHILIGLDHVLFLITLLLPAVLVRAPEGRWMPVARLRTSLLRVLGVVTSFTVAHSITLTLAALGLVSVPSRLVESAIALSVLLMALNNLRPTVRETGLIVFFFGLFHGLGFATVMGHLTFRMIDLVKVMLAFNVGVELGQIGIVAFVFPLLFVCRGKSWFQPLVLVCGSALVALVAAIWLIERAGGF